MDFHERADRADQIVIAKRDRCRQNRFDRAIGKDIQRPGRYDDGFAVGAGIGWVCPGVGVERHRAAAKMGDGDWGMQNIC